jgi:hypothetical protein
MSPLRLLTFAALLGAGVVPAVAAPSQPPVIGCASLVNLRLLMRQTKTDAVAAAALLGNDQADHLGCVVLARDAVTALREHLTLNGNVYDCLSLKTTTVCHWVVAGSVNLGEVPPKAKPGDKARTTEKAPATPEKVRR